MFARMRLDRGPKGKGGLRKMLSVSLNPAPSEDLLFLQSCLDAGCAVSGISCVYEGQSRAVK